MRTPAMASFLLLSERSIQKAAETWLEKESLNKRQCKNLIDNFQKGVDTFKKMHHVCQRDVSCLEEGSFQQVEKELFQIVSKAMVLVEECCNDDWCHVVVMQINNKESFRELLVDLECYFHSLCNIFRYCFPGYIGDINEIEKCVTFYPTFMDEIKADQKSLSDRLLKHLDLCTIEERTLVHYLVGRIEGLQRAEGGELDSIIFPTEYPQPEYGRPPIIPLGGGAGGCVFRTNWSKHDSVTKVIKVHDTKHEDVVRKEACILGGLDHPNIIRLFCCGLRTQKHFEEESKTFEIVMERGKMDLSCFLEKQSASSEANAIEIMLQIASGMCYLHDMKVAHRDLKPCNVVVTNLEDVHVKLVDFGISKLQVTNFEEIPTGEDVYGTCGYLAPEAFEKRRSKVDVFKTDVFSFGMMCFEILSRRKAFERLSCREYVKIINEGRRPELPDTCSNGLKSLIHDCWCLDYSKRPTFLDIYKRLTNLKSEAMLKTFYDIKPHVKESTFDNSSIRHPMQWWQRFEWSFIWQLFSIWQMFIIFNKWVSCFLCKVREFNKFTTSLPSVQEIDTTLSNDVLYEVSIVLLRIFFIFKNNLKIKI